MAVARALCIISIIKNIGICRAIYIHQNYKIHYNYLYCI